MRTFADYELVEQLQPGNHGTFYLARPPARLAHPEQLVALKILDRHATDNEFKRMAAELNVLLELNHPHLVAVLDAGHEDGRLYYATRFYRDGSLSLGPANDVAAVLTQVADAAEAAHALHEVGVAHRDIKPSNILLAEGRGHLSDLGVANYADANFTTTGTSPVGTLAYADPRLIHGDPAGRASDVWSLGATLHAAVTGQSIMGEIPNVHLAGAIEYVLGAQATIAPSCPQSVAVIVERATQEARYERYLTAADMAAELRAAARTASASAVAPSPPPTPSPPPAPAPIPPPAAPIPPPPPPPASFSPSPSPSPARPAPVPAASPPPPPSAAGVGGVSPDGPSVPLDLEQPGGQRPTERYAQPVMVFGHLSVAGHLNHPQAAVCWVSGEQRGSRGPWTPAEGERPPLGVLVFDDDRTYVIRWDTVLGRQPDTNERVATGRAAPLGLEGELTMSRAHLLIELRDWDVHVTDISSNGTSVVPLATGRQERLSPGQPHLLRSGDVLVVEERMITFRSHHLPGG